MLAISVRVRPCSARWSPRSVGRVTLTAVSSTTTFMSWDTAWLSSPFGPLTLTRPGSTGAATPGGRSIGLRPIRLMALPHEAEHLAADAALRGLAAGDHAGRGGQDGGAEPAEHLRQAVVLGVDAPARLGDPLQALDDPLAAVRVLQGDGGRLERAVLRHAPALDVALLLQQPRDLDLQLRGGQSDLLVPGEVRVADARQEVGDGIGDHLLLTNSTSSCPGSRRRARGRAGRCGRSRTS